MDFYSNGKLLITGEYLVLNGAKSLALPTKFGQNLKVIDLSTTLGYLHWESNDKNNNQWFFAKFELSNFNIIETSNKSIAHTLQKIFKSIKKQKPTFFSSLKNDIKITTQLNFEQNWGLGTSSTLINNIANWAEVDAFDLQFQIFGGSAYDIACAKNNSPIIYELKDKNPIIKKVLFNPTFKNQLYFVYLNKKQNSRDAIKSYQKKQLEKKTTLISEISDITNKIIKTSSLSEFERLLKTHESIISKTIGLSPIQDSFADYRGQIKSLGAWGGDFILATGDENSINYFKSKGLNTILTFNEMIL